MSNEIKNFARKLSQLSLIIFDILRLYIFSNFKIHGPLSNSSNSNDIVLPMVLCVGNHSSGKSSFINYVLGRPIQTAGVAPTDDNFTIIAPSSNQNDYDQDGFAIIGNIDYGFHSLQQFGPTLQHHTVFKLRSNINSNFIMGMS